MRSFTLLVFSTLIASAVFGQNYTVIHAKRSFRSDGQRLKVGSELKPQDTVFVNERGLLTLDINYPRNLTMEAGIHRLDSLIEDLKAKYVTHKRLVSLLNKKGISDCKFAYQAYAIPGSNNHYVADRIGLLEESIDHINSDSVLLSIVWKNPDKEYLGNHVIVLQQGYGQELLVHTEESDSNAVSVNIARRGFNFLQYSVIAEDCRSSQAKKIRLY